MSQTLLQTRGRTEALGAPVTACCFDRTGSQAAFALGDGSVALFPRAGGAVTRVQLHDGAVLSLAPDAAPAGFVAGGDDGRLMRIGADGGAQPIHTVPRRWIEHVASVIDGSTRLVGCAAGKQVFLFDGAGALQKTLDHPSTVTGIAFDARGKRVAASHYNGASVWFAGAKIPTPRLLEWKGSHTGIAMHPAAEAVVTAMQENALHGWRLPDGQHMRMSGYPAKCESLNFTRTGKWLASAGADAIVLWPFFGGGPTGKPPLELAQREGVLINRVACHPKEELVAAAFIDGTIIAAQIPTQRLVIVAEGEGSPVAGLGWSPDGGMLAFATEASTAAVIDLS